MSAPSRTEPEVAGYVCTRCWSGSCSRNDGDRPCGDLACTCGCEPYEEDDHA